MRMDKLTDQISSGNWRMPSPLAVGPATINTSSRCISWRRCSTNRAVLRGPLLEKAGAQVAKLRSESCRCSGSTAQGRGFGRRGAARQRPSTGC